VARTDTRNKATSIDDVDRNIAKGRERKERGEGKGKEGKDLQEGSEKRIRHRSDYKKFDGTSNAYGTLVKGQLETTEWKYLTH